MTLKEQIAYYDDLYYNHDISEISDAEYDALRAQLAEEEKDFVPGEAQEQFKKVEHKEPILSLGKANGEEALRKALEKLMPVLVEPKFDGLTLVKYPNKQIVSRGNGFVGEDVSMNTRHLFNNGASHPTLPVRMEAMMSKADFESINKERIAEGLEPFKNPRNAAAGMIRNKDTSKIKGVTYRAYNIVGSDLSESEQIQEMKDCHFDVTDSWRFEDIDAAVDFIMNFDRDAYPYELDGMVAKADIESAMEKYGTTGHHPKSMVAFKFEAQGGWTRLNDIIWQAGRTGRLTPVALIEPIDILGSTISRVTLHNQAYIDSMKLSKGCQVNVVKANDVIPAIVASEGYNPLTRFKPVTSCPTCGHELTEDGQHLFCYNPDCETKTLERVCHIAKRDALDIEGLSTQTVQKMMDQGLINKPTDIFELSKDEIRQLEGFAEVSALKLYNNIQAVRQGKPLDKVMYASGIPMLGRTASKKIANAYGTIQALHEDKLNLSRILEIEGLGEAVRSNFVQNYKMLADLLEYVDPLDVVQTEPVPVAADSKSFVITGKLERPRKYYEELLASKGHKVAGSVSGNTDYLVCNDKNSTSSKSKKAQSLNIPIISEDELLNIVNE